MAAGAQDPVEVSDDSNITSRHRALGAAERASPLPAVHEACLVILHGEMIGRRLPLTQAAFVIGRSSQSDLQLDDESVSRKHSRVEPITPGGSTYRITDLTSTNGTWVNDRMVTQTELFHGDRVAIGRNILKFLASGEAESAYHEEIYRLVTTDALTQLANRRAFEEALNREYSRATRYQRPMSVVVLDIDLFKRINDTHGHLAGDAMLRQLGVLLRNNIRRDDLAGRLGGEEFAVLLPEIDHAGGLAAADKLRRCVAIHQFQFDGVTIPLTISAGVATKTPEDKDALSLVQRADEKLFDAKRSGRNCIRG